MPLQIHGKTLRRRWANQGSAPHLRDDIALYELADGRWLGGWVSHGYRFPAEDDALEWIADYKEANPGTGWIEVPVNPDGPQPGAPFVGV